MLNHFIDIQSCQVTLLAFPLLSIEQIYLKQFYFPKRATSIMFFWHCIILECISTIYQDSDTMSVIDIEEWPAKVHSTLLLECLYVNLGALPCGSASKESACNVGDLGLIPVLSGPITSCKQMGKQWQKRHTLFFWAPKSLQMVTAFLELKDICSLEEKLCPIQTAY